MLWVKVGDFLNVFEVCVIPEILNDMGHPKDMDALQFTGKEMLEFHCEDDVSQGMFAFLSGKDISKLRFSLRNLVQSKVQDVEGFVADLYQEADSRFDNTRLLISPESLKAACGSIKYGRARIAEELIFCLPEEIREDLAKYMRVKRDLPSRMGKAVARLPEDRFYRALEQIIKAGLKNAKRKN